MSPNKHLIIGGARSGKSRLAEQYAAQSQQTVIYIATAKADDNEMQARIKRHKAEREHAYLQGEHIDKWQVIEEPLALAETITQYSCKDNCLLIDCLTLWLSNHLCLDKAFAPEQSMAEYLESLQSALVLAVKNAPGKIILVSNEVGHGIVPMGELSRQFVDYSGWLHQALAQVCDHVDFVIAGLPLTMKANTQDDMNNNLAGDH